MTEGDEACGRKAVGNTVERQWKDSEKAALKGTNR